MFKLSENKKFVICKVGNDTPTRLSIIRIDEIASVDFSPNRGFIYIIMKGEFGNPRNMSIEKIGEFEGTHYNYCQLKDIVCNN